MYEALSAAIHSADKVALFMHVRPDGDAVGSALATKRYLENLGKRVDIFVENHAELRQNLRILPGFSDIGKCRYRRYDLGIALDTATAARLGTKCQGLYFGRCGDHALVDHHYSSENFGEIIVREPNAAATCEILYKFFAEHDNSAIDQDVATCLYAGLITDSGALTFSNTSVETLNIAAQLAAYGVDRYTIIQKLFKEIRREVFQLKLRVLSRAEFLADGKCGLIVFKQSDFAATGTTDLDTEGLINNIVNIEGVSLAIAASEREDMNSYQFSVRAKDGVNAAAFAEKFGGGGHICASGLRLLKGGEEGLNELRTAAEEFLSAQDK